MGSPHAVPRMVKLVNKICVTGLDISELVARL